MQVMSHSTDHVLYRRGWQMRSSGRGGGRRGGRAGRGPAGYARCYEETLCWAIVYARAQPAVTREPG